MVQCGLAATDGQAIHILPDEVDIPRLFLRLRAWVASLRPGHIEYFLYRWPRRRRNRRFWLAEWVPEHRCRRSPAIEESM